MSKQTESDITEYRGPDPVAYAVVLAVPFVMLTGPCRQRLLDFENRLISFRTGVVHNNW